MQINSLAEALKGVSLPEPKKHVPTLPIAKFTPRPEKTKVVSNPVRLPINRQAALVLRPNKSWLSQPLPPEKLPTPQDKEIERLKADLKTAHNAHAGTRDELGETRHQLRHAKSLIEKLYQELRNKEKTISEQADTIRQLEDLKL